MTRVLVLVSFAIAAFGCGSDSHSERFTNTDQGFAVDQPESWQRAIVRGFVQFTPTDKKLAKHTIVVRVANKPREIFEGTPTTVSGIITTTERVLRSLHRSKVTSHSKLNGAALPGARFSLTFVPRGSGKTYRREHVVLVGTKRVFHVMYTAPASESIDQAAFEDVVKTLVEEA